MLLIIVESNALIYGAGTGWNMFETMITKLYQLKQHKVPFIKDMMLLLWDSLSSIQKINTIVLMMMMNK